MIRITDQYFWNVVFLFFYLCLLTMASIILNSGAYIPIEKLSLYDVTLIALASQRLIRLFVYDNITKFFREQFYVAQVSKTGEVVLFKPERGPRRTIVDLLTCVWCFGLWATSVVAFFYMLTPWAAFPVLILALASVATVFQNISRLIANKID